MSFPLSCCDQMGHRLHFDRPPVRIVSLVPSITLTLFDLGLAHAVAGRTKFCIHPAGGVKGVPVVGGTKQFHIDRIEALSPDLIIANKEENGEALIRELQASFTVYVSDVRDLEDNYRMISDVGQITGTDKTAEDIIRKIRTGFEQLHPPVQRSAAYLIWKGPWMAAGSDTFIDDMLRRCGLSNIFGQKAGRYPEVTEAEIAAAAPEIILLSSEPYPFKEKHMAGLAYLCPAARILLADGEYFSWYGSRLSDSPVYFRQLLGGET